MIARLTGSVLAHTRNPLVIDVHGVGYGVFVPQTVLAAASAGTVMTLFTHTYVREDALTLFGFVREDELALFELLLTVSGIGPKTALSVLDRGGEATHRAIAAADVGFFTAVPRLGKKNAQKIIIELKSKLGSPGDLDLAKEESPESKQIMQALLSMGFDKKEARDAVKKLPDGTLEEKLKSALKMLG